MEAKVKSIKIISLMILTASFVNGQEIGIDFNVGYSKLEMEQVNKYLDNSDTWGTHKVIVNIEDKIIYIKAKSKSKPKTDSYLIKKVK